MEEIAIFKDEATEKGLNDLIKYSDTLPDKILDKEDYKLIYLNYQNAKKLRIAISKKSKGFVNTVKAKFESEKQIITNEEKRILDIVSPVENKLKVIRDEWEESQKIEAKKKADEIAEKQKIEFNRQEIIRIWEQAHIDNADFDQKIIDDLAREKKEAELKEREEEIILREKELKIKKTDQCSEVFGKTGITAESAVKGSIFLAKQGISLSKPTAKAALELEKQGVTLIEPKNESCNEEKTYQVVDCTKSEFMSVCQEEFDQKSIETTVEFAADAGFPLLEVEFIVNCPKCNFKFNAEAIKEKNENR